MKPALLGIVLSLAFAAPAAAETFVVQPDGGACASGGDLTCGTITAAVEQAGGDDTIEVRNGTYAEAVSIPGAKDGLTVAGAGAAIVTGAGGGDVFTVAADDVTVSGLQIQVPAEAGSALAVAGSGTFRTLVVTRTGGNTEPAIDLTGGAVALEQVAVTNQEGQLSSGVRSTGAGLTISDSFIVSNGPAVRIERSAANEIVRSSLFATNGDAAGVEVISAGGDSDERALRLESTFISGQASGLRAVSGDGADEIVGPIDISGAHATILGLKGMVLDSQGASKAELVPGTAEAQGNIAADLASSIVYGTIEARQYDPGLNLLTAANTATATLERSNWAGEHADAEDEPNGSATCDYNPGGGNDPCPTLAPGDVFIPGTLGLRQDSALIDQGLALEGGESDKDFEGDPRVVDGPDADTTAASDIGADEFVNKAPTAGLTPSTRTPVAGEEVTFTSTSKDPEQAGGGGIVTYAWNFGDGTTTETTTPEVKHAYAATGKYNATVTVTDNLGAKSAASAPASLEVFQGPDKTAPVVKILAPESGQRLRLGARTVTLASGKRFRRKPVALTINGSVVDPSGIKQVDVALRLVKRTKKSKRPRKGTCEWYRGGKRFLRDRCKDGPHFVKATRTGQTWKLVTPRGWRVKKGRYNARVRATDTAGNVTQGFSKAAGTLVSFRVR